MFKVRGDFLLKELALRKALANNARKEMPKGGHTYVKQWFAISKLKCKNKLVSERR